MPYHSDSCSRELEEKIKHVRNVVKHWGMSLKGGKGFSVHVPSLSTSRDFEIWYMWYNWDPLPITMSWAVYCWHFRRWMCLEMCPVHWSFPCQIPRCFWSRHQPLRSWAMCQTTGLTASIGTRHLKCRDVALQTQLAPVFLLMYLLPADPSCITLKIAKYVFNVCHCMHTHAIQVIAEE